MAANDDHEVGRQVVGAMRAQVQSAGRTMAVDFQEGAKQFSLTATRAAAAQPALERGPHVAFFTRGGFPGPDRGRLVHGYHDLPRFDLPVLLLSRFCPDLRFFLRGLRPGCALASVWRRGAASVRAASRLRPREITRPSDNRSN